MPGRAVTVRWRRLWRECPEVAVIAVFLFALFLAELAAWLIMS